MTELLVRSIVMQCLELADAGKTIDPIELHAHCEASGITHFLHYQGARYPLPTCSTDELGVIDQEILSLFVGDYGSYFVVRNGYLLLAAMLLHTFVHV